MGEQAAGGGRCAGPDENASVLVKAQTPVSCGG
jgi:hypothetical protein